MPDKSFKFEIESRPWYEWLGWSAWFIAMVIAFQSAVASGAEFEPRAASTFWVIFGMLLVGGGIVYLVRRYRP